MASDWSIQSTTDTTSLTNTMKSYYDRIMLEAMDPTLVYYQFGVKKPLPTGEGKTIIWNLPTRLAKGMVLSEGVPTSTANALSTYKVSAIIRQFGGFTAISDIVDLTSISDVMKMAMQRLGAQAGETIERVIVNEIGISHVTTTGGALCNFTKTSGGVFEDWGSVSGVSVCSNGTIPGGPVGAVSSAHVIAVSDIRKAVYKLKSLNAPAFEGNDYMSIINTETAEDLVGDSTWINFHQYVDKGVQDIYNGEIGRIYGCRFVETTQGPTTRCSNAGGVASGIAHGTLIMGKGYYGVTELDGGIQTFPVVGAQKGDPLNQTSYYGWKANFIAKILNTSAGVWFWAGSAETTLVGDESATGSELRYLYPTAY